jgi:hypothetical protein
MAVGLANLSTLTFGTSGYALYITGWNRTGHGVDDVQTSHLGTTGLHTYIPTAIAEGGELSLDVQYDPATEITIGGTAENITLDPAASGDTVAFSGYVKSYEYSGKVNELMTGTIVVKVAGAAA